MAKLPGFRKVIKWIRIGDDLKEISTQTRAESVIMADQSTLEEKLSDYNPAYADKAGNADYATNAGTAENAKYATSAGTANAVAWDNVSGKPSTFSPSSHNHDDRYFTETEVNNKLSGYSVSSHNHDGRYYTESEIDSKLTNYSTAKFSYSNGTLTITN